MTAGQHCDNLRSTRDEINELTRLIQRLKTELEHSKAQVGKGRRESYREGEAGSLALSSPESGEIKTYQDLDAKQRVVQKNFQEKRDMDQKEGLGKGGRRNRRLWNP